MSRYVRGQWLAPFNGGAIMHQNYFKQGLAALATVLVLTTTQAAYAYDSAITASIGPYAFDYQDQTQGAKETTIGWRLGYVGRFNENFGFDVRAGGAQETSLIGVTVEPGLFLSVLFRPAIPVSQAVDLYGLIGFTSMAVDRTPVNQAEEIIARVGPSLGVGANYRINQHMATGIEGVSYQHNVDYGPDDYSSNWFGVTRAEISLRSLTVYFKYQF